jgi:hypothetical protein
VANMAWTNKLKVAHLCQICAYKKTKEKGQGLGEHLSSLSSTVSSGVAAAVLQKRAKSISRLKFKIPKTT